MLSFNVVSDSKKWPNMEQTDVLAVLYSKAKRRTNCIEPKVIELEQVRGCRRHSCRSMALKPCETAEQTRAAKRRVAAYKAKKVKTVHDCHPVAHSCHSDCSLAPAEPTPRQP